MGDRDAAKKRLDEWLARVTLDDAARAELESIIEAFEDAAYDRGVDAGAFTW